MPFSALDWTLIAAYFVASAIVGLIFTRRASTSGAEYFVSGRALPWWLAGTSMVATTFAADTPLAVAGMVASNGVAGNWLWWNMAIGGVLTVFFFARLWRRAGIVTDAEFTELRYSGRPARALRVFRALYMALPINLIVIGWVNLAMLKILAGTLGVGTVTALAVMGAVILVYSALSGLWGVVVTDAFQFVLAMAGSILLAVFAVQAVGGLDALVEKLPAVYGSRDAALAFFPQSGAAWMPPAAFVSYLLVQWWATSYPGSEPGGGGYIAQRMFSAKSERDSLLATLWFTIAHYAVRPWPWVLTGFAVVLLYGRADPAGGYVRASVELMPNGLRGLMLASFAAAYMSTLSTQLNWGASYLVNDVLARVASVDERRTVWIARAMTAAIFAASMGVTWLLAKLGSIESAWRLLIALGAGTGPVLILRWYWWRISAWTEIAAMIAALVSFSALTLGGVFDPADPLSSTWLMLTTTAVTTVTWIAVTFLAPQTAPEILRSFYERVHPGGPGWRHVRAQLPNAPRDEAIAGGSVSWLNWLAGVVSVYGALFGTGKLLLGSPREAVAYLSAGAIAFAFIAWNLRRETAPATASART